MKRPLRARATVLLFAAALGFSNGAQSQEPRSRTDFGVMGTAKILCSAVFVEGRNLDEALRNSVGFLIRRTDWQLLVSRSTGETDAAIKLDRKAGIVQVTLQGFTGRAKYHGDQGCVVMPPGFDEVFFEPVKLQTTLPDPMTQPWPMGDVLPQEPFPPGVNEAKVKEAVDAAFEGNGLTAALVVVYKGRIIGERYGQGADKDTQLIGWSMGKSLTATLVGVLARQGHFALHDPAPVELWRRDPEDPRARIRISDLLRMSSGLRFTSWSDPPYEWGRAIHDHHYIYTGGIDAFNFSITRPAEFPPNTVGRYRNCDPLILGYIVRQTVEKMGESYLSWPQKALFDRIGIRNMVLEPDPYGNFLLSSFEYGTGRNWARLGLLYLQDGVWEGERILPDGWVDFVSTPAPAWNAPVYGGLFWLNGRGRGPSGYRQPDGRYWNLPTSAYYMVGAGGQFVIIVPSHDLVVVRLGHRQGLRTGQAALNVALGKLIEAIDAAKR